MVNSGVSKRYYSFPYYEADILINLSENGFVNQRKLSESSGLSLGQVNKVLNSLTGKGLLDEKKNLTPEALSMISENSPERAVILAAGFGMRMVPINLTAPKAMLEVKEEKLIERLIRQLQAAGINDITVVVGFMMESFEYLIDDFGVNLVVNDKYASKNNLHSLCMASDKLENCYVVPGDLWCEDNPFRSRELYSWYMISDQTDIESSIRVNRKRELIKVKDSLAGNKMIGISYLTSADGRTVADTLNKYDSDRNYDNAFWEEALYKEDRMIVSARIVPGNSVTEINTYEQLRELDKNSLQLHSDAIETISDVLHVSQDQISDITVLKKGMTNRSFLFTVCGRKYIMRIPGEGTEKLINRKQEAEVYRAISGRGLCDDPVYINPDTGYKITAFLDNVRVCDSGNEGDLRICMHKLKEFHEMKLSVGHTFDIFGQIQFYEELWNGAASVYQDYKTTKANVLKLKDYIDSCEKDWCLTHIDAVPDNFLFYHNVSGEDVQLTDWEYAGMQDPHVDIAMFCIYSLYSKEAADHLIDLYFDNQCPAETRIKIYCYIAACGLLWSNWCEYKRALGVEFGEYSLRQYRYAKDYYKYAVSELEKTTGE